VQEWVASIGHDPDRIRRALAAPNKGGADLPTHRDSSSDPPFTWHSKIESTVRYLGMEVDDAIEIAQMIDI
jgi:hypothetical protein